MKKVLLFLMFALLLFSFSCGKKNKGMVILTENYPPLSYIEAGEVSGFGADVVNAIQNELGTEIKPELVEWDTAYQRALNEPNVVLFTMEKTEEREDKFHFIGPLGNNTTYFYARADKDIEIPDLDSARQARIATTTNWFSEQMLKDKGFKNLLSNPDPVTALQMVWEGKTELGIFTDVTFARFCEEVGRDVEDFKPVLKLANSQYYIAISKATDMQIVQEWQSAFDKLHNIGTITSLREKWHLK